MRIACTSFDKSHFIPYSGAAKQGNFWGTQPQKVTLCVIYQIQAWHLWIQKSDGAKAVP